MTNTLKAWLKAIPGVVVNYTSDSIILEVVAHSDWTACLNVVSQEQSPLNHSWMRVSRGQWSGKTALMIEETINGCNCLLKLTLSVLLHLYIDGTVHISAHPVLFDGQEMLKAHGLQMVMSKGPYRFQFQKNIYEHGLLQVFLPCSRLLETEEIDDTDLELFAASTHPETLHGLASIPLPKSWRFFPQEKVDVSAVLFDAATVILSLGTIAEVCSDGLFICDNSDGTTRWIDSWLTVTKHFEMGDYVNLSHDSWEGFVEAVQGHHLCLLSVKRSPGLTCTFKVEKHTVHANSAVKTSEGNIPSEIHAAMNYHQNNGSLTTNAALSDGSGMLPWLGKQVYIVGEHHRMRGTKGVIVDWKASLGPKNNSTESDLKEDLPSGQGDNSSSGHVNTRKVIYTLQYHALIQSIVYRPATTGFQTAWISGPKSGGKSDTKYM